MDIKKTVLILLLFSLVPLVNAQSTKELVYAFKDSLEHRNFEACKQIASNPLFKPANFKFNYNKYKKEGSAVAMSLLFFAIKERNPEIIRIVIDKLDVERHVFYTDLWSLIEINDVQNLKYILENSNDKNLVNNEVTIHQLFFLPDSITNSMYALKSNYVGGITLLQYAYTIEMMDMLIAKGADANQALENRFYFGTEILAKIKTGIKTPIIPTNSTLNDTPEIIKNHLKKNGFIFEKDVLEKQRRKTNPTLLTVIQKIQPLVGSLNKSDKEKLVRYTNELKDVLAKDSSFYWEGTGFLLLETNKAVYTYLLKNGLDKKKITLENVSTIDAAIQYVKAGHPSETLDMFKLYSAIGNNVKLIELISTNEFDLKKLELVLSESINKRHYDLAELLVKKGVDVSGCLNNAYASKDEKSWLLLFSSSNFKYDPAYMFTYYTTESGEDGYWNTTRQKEHYVKFSEVMRKWKKEKVEFYTNVLMLLIENRNSPLPESILDIYTSSEYSPEFKKRMLEIVIGDRSGIYMDKQSVLFSNLFHEALLKKEFDLAERIVQTKIHVGRTYVFIINDYKEALTFLLKHDLIKDEECFFFKDNTSILEGGYVTPLQVAVCYKVEWLVKELLKSGHDIRKEVQLKTKKKIDILQLAKKVGVTEEFFEFLKVEHKKAMVKY